MGYYQILFCLTHSALRAKFISPYFFVLFFSCRKKPSALAMLMCSSSVEQCRGGTIPQREGQTVILQGRFRA